jgi:D-amino-acid oxidase
VTASGVRHATVVGGGVSGLTTAVVLVEAGLPVTVVTAERPELTTSAAAGALWGPYRVEPADLVRAWSRQSLQSFELLASDPATGVRMAPGLEASRHTASPPEWADDLPNFGSCEPEALPPGFCSGWRFSAPLVDMPRYLHYLVDRLLTAGGQLVTRRVGSLEELMEPDSLLVNCSGIDAGQLARDPSVTAIRGQLVVLENPGLTEFFSEETGDSPDLLHVYPHGDNVVIGGIAVPGNWSRAIDPLIADQILQRCCQIVPDLQSVPVLEHRAGLRPTRPTVRVEREDRPEGTIVHNYGHGGAGVTLSWGCANTVAKLIGVVAQTSHD